MILAWSLCIPAGVITSSLCRTEVWWFKVHRALQSLGVILTAAGIGIIVQGINDVHGAHMHGVHTKVGVTVAALALLQPIAAFLRPRAPEATESKTNARRTWEKLHRFVGWMLLLLGLLNIFSGLFNAHVERSTRNELAPLLAVCFVAVAAAAVVAVLRARRTARTAEAGNEHNKGHPTSGSDKVASGHTAARTV